MKSYVSSRVLLTFAFLFVAANAAFACNCVCPHAETIEVKACNTSDPGKCSGDYAVTGCDTIHPQNDCFECVGTPQVCCLSHYTDYQNDGRCGGLAKKQIEMIRQDKELLSGEVDVNRVFVPGCRGTYMSLDQVMASTPIPVGVERAFITER